MKNHPILTAKNLLPIICLLLLTLDIFGQSETSFASITSDFLTTLDSVWVEVVQAVAITVLAYRFNKAKKIATLMTVSLIILTISFSLTISGFIGKFIGGLPIAAVNFLISTIPLLVYLISKLIACLALCLISKKLSTRIILILGTGILLPLVSTLLNNIHFSYSWNIYAQFLQFPYTQAAFGLVFIMVGGISLILKSGSAETDGLHGSAKFASKRDLKEFESEVEPGAFILAPVDPKKTHGKISLSRSLSVMHGLILGGSGTGKSRGYFMPNCAEARNTSLVVTDPKSELWNYTSGFQPNPVRYAPTEPQASFCFNWIPLCEDARMSELCARAIMTAGSTHKTDQFWIDAETAFLSAIFSHTATLKYPTPLTAYKLFTRQKPEELLQELINSPSYIAREQAIIFEQTDARIKGAIVPAVASRMQFMRDKNIQLFTSAEIEAPDFGRLRHTPMAVYWCLREQDIARLRPLTSLFFTVLLEQIAGEEIHEGTSGTPITLMLDEFANIGKIPDFETTISLARGRGVALWLGVQSLSQLSQTYGSHAAQTIMSNCATKVALHGLDYQTADYVSRMLGERTIAHTRNNFNVGLTGFSVGTGQAEHRRQLLTADEVMRIGENEAIARTSNKYPMRIYKGYYDAEPKTSSNIKTLSEVKTEDEDEILI